jgi:hypothetical protein
MARLREQVPSVARAAIDLAAMRSVVEWSPRLAANASRARFVVTSRLANASGALFDVPNHRA